MARPRPVPALELPLRRTKPSKIRSRSSGGTPGPLSTRSPARGSAIAGAPPGSGRRPRPRRTALSSRLRSARVSASGSPMHRRRPGVRDGDAGRACAARVSAHHRLAHLREVDGLGAQRLVGLQAREVEQVVDEPARAAGSRARARPRADRAGAAAAARAAASRRWPGAPRPACAARARRRRGTGASPPPSAWPGRPPPPASPPSRRTTPPSAPARCRARRGQQPLAAVARGDPLAPPRRRGAAAAAPSAAPAA